MKNIALLLICCCACSVFLIAQDSAIMYKTGMLSKGKVAFYGNKYDGSIVEFDAPPKVVEDAIKEMMNKRGYKPAEKKDFLIYKNVLLRNTEIQGAVDVYASVDAKSRSEKNKTLVSLIITMPGAIPENKIEKSQATAVATIGISGTGASLLSNMEEDVSIAAHNNELALQQALILKTEKELSYLVKDSIDYQKRMENLKLDIEQNSKAQTAAKQKLLDATNRLDMIKARKLEKKN